LLWKITPCLAVLAAVGFLLLPPETAAADKLPNIVFILADDLGYGDIKSFGKERCQVETPNFDLLAKGGVRFTNAHASASVCVPSRLAILTGRYPFRFGRAANGGPWGFIGLQMKKTQFTLARMLQGAGYRTACIGKWHLGTTMTTRDGKVQGLTNVDYTKPLLAGPNDYGFDESFILPGSLDMYPYVFVRNHEFVGKVTAQKGWSAFNRVGPAAEDFEDWKVLDTFGREAAEFITREARKKKPFFLYLALTSPHTPTSPSPPFAGRSQLGLYGDFIMETDAVVGRVLATLDRTGAAKNTLVIAASDHGAALYAGRRRKATFAQLKQLEKEGHYSSGPYRGYKFSVYEGGFRIPCVARWPGVVPPGGSSDALIGLQDLLATAAEITGARLKAEEAPDSVSFLPLLKNPAAKGTRDTLVVQGAPAMAFHSGPWKLALCPGSGCAGRYGNSPPQEEAWKKALAAYGKTPANRKELEKAPFVQLFRLDRDPGETKNLAAEHPEKVKELFKLIGEQIAAGRSTPGPRVTNDREGIDLFRGIPRFVWRKQP
jgi:arylsulfatase A-like enzyme